MHKRAEYNSHLACLFEMQPAELQTVVMTPVNCASEMQLARLQKAVMVQVDSGLQFRCNAACFGLVSAIS